MSGLRSALLALAFLAVQPVGSEEVRAQAPIERLRVLFAVVTGTAADGEVFGTGDYEAVLRRSAATLARETQGHVELTYTVTSIPIGDADTGLGYAAASLLEWQSDIEAVLGPEPHDVLAFAPDHPVPWCTDAHSLGVVTSGKRLLCLEAPRPRALVSNLLIHKLFHTFGFFHQHLRNKQYRLLDWELGLPAYTRMADVGDPGDAVAFFSPMALAAIEEGLRCDQPGDRPGECRDVAGPFRLDADHDGTRDDLDGYPMSPPGGGPDSDGDGIPDALDLCPGNGVSLEGEVEGGPLNYRSHPPVVTLSSTAGDVRWTPPSIDYTKQLGDAVYFDDARETSAQPMRLETGAPVRVRVRYAYRGRLLRRTAYVYGANSRTSPGPWAYFEEKAWLYFARFGCDPPDGLDLYDVATYDADGDGLPGAAVAPFDVARLAVYDWDGDGVPDRLDTLPTVAGTCSDAHVRGVKDSDGDGFCDPGYLVYSPLVGVAHRSYFGEIPTGMGNDPDADLCPYLAGPSHGCPHERWYDDGAADDVR